MRLTYLMWNRRIFWYICKRWILIWRPVQWFNAFRRIPTSLSFKFIHQSVFCLFDSLLSWELILNGTFKCSSGTQEPRTPWWNPGIRYIPWSVPHNRIFSCWNRRSLMNFAGIFTTAACITNFFIFRARTTWNWFWTAATIRSISSWFD